MLATTYDTKFRIDPSTTVQGTNIAAEDDLGLDDSQFLILGELTLLPGDRHLVRLSGLSAAVIVLSILIGDCWLPALQTAKSGFRLPHLSGPCGPL